MFIGRKHELDKLNKMYLQEKFHFAVVYGRRRVGKTTLINEFVRDKETIFFTGIESNEKQNLENFSHCIFSLTDEEMTDNAFASFQKALEYVFRRAGKRRIVLVMDEYPYVAKASKSLASVLQALIDKNKDDSRLFLILCGSSMSFMESQVLGYKAPLYGRRTGQFRIEPFDFFESREYFHGFTDEELACIYGMVGGTPQYLAQLDESLSLKTNIKELFLEPISPLYEEPNNLLKQEVREPAAYNAIIAAIAGGASRLNEIAAKVGEANGSCVSYIRNLMALGIIKKETPYGEKAGRRTIYRIADNLFRFWYRFIPKNIAAINRGLPDEVYTEIESQLAHYMGAVFEEICIQYLWKLRANGKVKTAFLDLGRWWGNDRIKRQKTEIDIMGMDDNKGALFGECKWRNEKTDADVLETLHARSLLFPHYNAELFLFSKTGFTENCRKRAVALENVSLVTFSDMMDI